jgi:hypothetical protein
MEVKKRRHIPYRTFSDRAEKLALIAKDRGVSMNRLIDEAMLRVIMEYEAKTSLEAHAAQAHVDQPPIPDKQKP